MKLNDNERIDELGINNMKIIQRTDGFCFGIDSVLLSDFAKRMKSKSVVVDLGTGTGIIGLLLCAKTKIKEITGIEVQSEIANMAERSININNLQDKFKIINCNIKNINEFFEMDSVDYVVTNPPYKKENSGKINDNKIKLISRHEILADLSDFIKASFKILKDHGSLFMVHRAERLVDIISEMRKYKMEPKRVRFVYSNVKSESKLVLIEAVKNGKSFLTVEKPLVVYDEKGQYTKEIKEIYNVK